MTLTSSKIALILLGVFLPYFVGLTESFACPATQIRCRKGHTCVYLHDVCRNGEQCPDGSDEDPQICSFWTYPHYNCHNGALYCGDPHGCLSIYDFCHSPCTSHSSDPAICELVHKGRLRLDGDGDGAKMVLTERLVSLMQDAVNITSKQGKSCPMFFVPVGEYCLSFFSPAKVSWPEARQFCTSLGADLVSVDDLNFFVQILDYLRDSHLTSDYWIGGRFDIDANAWAWVQDDSSMPLGSPYWGTRYNKTCIQRPPPHTDPSSVPPLALPGALCSNYYQTPSNRAAGWCAAVTYEHYHFFTDEPCVDTFSPLCQRKAN